MTHLPRDKEEEDTTIILYYTTMSANGSDFENDGDFIHEPSAKKSRLDPQVVQGHGEVLQLHTGWDSRDDAVRHATACKHNSFM